MAFRELERRYLLGIPIALTAATTARLIEALNRPESPAQAGCLGRGYYHLASGRGSTQDRLFHADRQYAGHGVVILIPVQVVELREEADRRVAHRGLVRMHHKSCLSK